jgi:hypothetical protein
MANSQNFIIGAASLCLDEVDIGYTTGGIEIAHEPEFLSVQSDQACGTTRIGRTSEKMMVRTTAQEVLLNQIRFAMGYAETNFDEGNQQKLWLGGECNSCDGLEEVELVVKGPGPNCGCRTFVFERAVSVGQTTLSFQRDQEMQMPVEFEILKSDDTGFFGFVEDGCTFQETLDCDGEPYSPY